MCRESLIYGTEYFLTPRPYNNQTNFFEIFLKGGVEKCILLLT